MEEEIRHERRPGDEPVYLKVSAIRGGDKDGLGGELSDLVCSAGNAPGTELNEEQLEIMPGWKIKYTAFGAATAYILSTAFFSTAFFYSSVLHAIVATFAASVGTIDLILYVKYTRQNEQLSQTLV